MTSISILTFPEVIAVTVLECDHDLHGIRVKVKSTLNTKCISDINRTEIQVHPRKYIFSH